MERKKGGPNQLSEDVVENKELLTKMAFFFHRPLRRKAQLNREVWGNLMKFFSDFSCATATNDP